LALSPTSFGSLSDALCGGNHCPWASSLHLRSGRFNHFFQFGEFRSLKARRVPGRAARRKRPYFERPRPTRALFYFGGEPIDDILGCSKTLSSTSGCFRICRCPTPKLTCRRGADPLSGDLCPAAVTACSKRTVCDFQAHYLDSERLFTPPRKTARHAGLK
jgi:hypothetical protein